MSYAQTGSFVVSDDIRITAAMARGLERLVENYVASNGAKDDQDGESLRVLAGLLTDRLTDLSEIAKGYVEAAGIVKGYIASTDIALAAGQSATDEEVTQWTRDVATSADCSRNTNRTG